MSRFTSIAAGILFAAAIDVVAAPEERPNIVFVIVDDLNSSFIRSLGGWFPSKGIDRLAEEGMIFRRAYSTSAMCVPTRYTCITGSYASRSTWFGPKEETGRILNNCFLEPHTVTVAQALQQAGYRTGHVGKWHSTADRDLERLSISEDADPRDPEVEEMLQENNARLSEVIRSFGYDYVGGLVDGNLDHSYPRAAAIHNMEYVVKGAFDFLEQDDDRPFFLWVAATLVHSPKIDLKQDDVRITPVGVREDHLGVMPPRQSILDRFGGTPNNNQAKMACLDDGVGALLDRLDELKIAENTLVIFMADQQHNGKGTCYENGANVSFLARWPRVIQAGSVCDALVDNTDLASTWMALAGAEPLPGMVLDGYSLMPLFRGQDMVLRDAVFLEMGYSKAVVTDRYSYLAVRYPQELLDSGFVPPRHGTVKEHEQQGTFDMFLYERNPFGQRRGVGIVDPDQLYDLKNDPEQQVNLASNPEYGPQFEVMKKLLRDKVKQSDRPFGEFD